MALIREALSTFKLSLFEPAITGSLLYVLTRGPPDLRERILTRLASLQYAPQTSTIIRSLQVLLALGIVGKLNYVLNRWALNGWRLSSGGADYDWPREVAVITGGSSGIGAQMVRRLAAKGIKVAIVDVQAPLKSTAEFPNVKFYQTDITSPDNVNAVAAKIKAELGPVSILINNAGIGTTNTILGITPKDLDKIFKVNLISHWYTIQAFLPGMIEAKKGHIVTVASMASFMCVAGIVDYCATKAGALALHEGLNQELKHRLGARFIKTTVVHPSWVKTPLIGDFEDGITPGGVMAPDYVAGVVCDNILKKRSGQIVLPPGLTRVTGVRGWANWLQEFARDRTGKLTLEHEQGLR